MATGLGQVGNVLQDVRRCLLGFFRAYFAQQDEFPNFRYSETPHLTRLFIGDQFPKEHVRVDARPALVTSRGAFQWARTGIGDDRVAMDLPRDSSVFARLYTGAILLRCVAPEGLEAESLAWIVDDLIHVYGGQISSKVPLVDIHQREIGEERPYKVEGAEVDWVEVPVALHMQVHSQYQVDVEGPTLSNYNLEVS